MKNLLILLASIPLIAFAKVTDNSFYTDIGIGGGSINYYSNSGGTGMVRIDGGYNLNQFVGFQFGVNNYFGANIQDNNQGTYNVNGYGFDLSVLPNLPLGQNAPVNLFLRLGVGYEVMNAPINNTNGFIDVIGAGIRYDISAHLALTGQYIGRGIFMAPAPANYYQNDFLASLGLYF